MENINKGSSEKLWKDLNDRQKNEAAAILKNRLINNCLISQNTDIQNVKGFLEKNKPSVIINFPDTEDRVLRINNSFSQGLDQNLQENIHRDTGNFILDEYIIKRPKIISIDDMFKSK